MMTRDRAPRCREDGALLSTRRGRPRWVVVPILTALLAGLGLAGVSCKKNDESLLLVSLTATPADATLTSVSVTISSAAASLAKVFPLPRGLTTTATTLGVYLASNLTGPITVGATASGNLPCAGYVGSTMGAAVEGGTATVAVVLHPGNTCLADGGTDAAAGGGGGAGGTSGSLAGSGGALGPGGATGGFGGASGISDAGGTSDALGVGGTGGASPGSGGTSGAIGTGGISGAAGASAGAGGTRGAGGASGAGGPGGAAGIGGAGGRGSSPPSLAHCTEYVHDARPDAACVSGDPSTDVEITDVAFSHDGKYLFTAGNDGRVKVWTWDGANLASEGHELDTSVGFVTVAVSPNSKLIAAGSVNQRLTVWNVGGAWSMAAALQGIIGDVSGVAFSPSSTTLFALDSIGLVASYFPTSLYPNSETALQDSGDPLVLAASPAESDGSYWLGVGYDDGGKSLLEVSAGNDPQVPDVPFGASSGKSPTFAMQFSPDGTMIAAGAEDGTFGIWSVPLTADFALPALRSPRLAISTNFIFSAAFHPSNAYIAISAGASDGARQLGIWSVTTGAVRSTVPNNLFSYRSTAVTFSPDGTTLVAGEHNCGKFLVCVN
jgi:WD40 domain-containing protein